MGRPARSLIPFALALASAPASPQAAIRTFHGETVDGSFGYDVDGAGDVDGDGYDDVIVGAVYYLDNTGYVRVLSGRDGAVLYAFDEHSAGTALGSGVAGGRDLDGDGWPDFLIGAYWDSVDWHYGGSLRAWSGRDGALLYTVSGTANLGGFGLDVEFLGDVDGDGREDFGSGAFREPSNGTRAGAAFVYSGADGRLLHRVLGDGPGDEYGRSLCGLGDLDGDGKGEFLVAGYASGLPSTPSYARVHSGADGRVLREHVGAFGASFGQAVARLGDLDGDGFDEYAIGAPTERTPVDHLTNAGAVHVFSGADGTELRAHHGEHQSTLGYAVAPAGDFDGDGVPDLLAGAPSVEASVGDPFVRVYSGADGAVLFEHRAPGGQFGNAVARAGDVNADGHADVLAADYKSDAAGESAGAVTVFGSACPAPRTYCEGLANSVGSGARIGHRGGPSVSFADLVLVVEGAVPGSPCLFVRGDARDAAPFGEGLRCVAGGLARVGPVRPAGPRGDAEQALARGPGGGGAPAGTTAYYQLFYRDPCAGCVGTNASDGLRVDFCP